MTVERMPVPETPLSGLMHTPVAPGTIMTAPSLAPSKGIQTVFISKLKGRADVRIEGGVWQPARAGMVLHANDEILTRADSTVEVLFGENGENGKLEIKANTHIRFDQLSANVESGSEPTRLDLATGKVYIEIPQLTDQTLFFVRTPNGTFRINQTSLELSVSEKDASFYDIVKFRLNYMAGGDLE